MMHKTLLSAAICFFSGVVHAQVQPIDPNRNWKVLETKHFEIIYDEPDVARAKDFANEAERAETLLQPILQTPMPQKVPIVLADVTDAANGAAIPVPRSSIELNPVFPPVYDELSEYFDWHRELISHEYTHILNFEPTSGFMSVLRFLLGTYVKPGHFLPSWYLEGLAVELESRVTPLGRGRSHYYSALVRAFDEDGSWGTETIDRIGMQTIPTWPRGSRPYTFGYFLIHQLSETPRRDNSKENIYGLLNHRYGGRIPWFLNGPVEDYFDKTYQELLDLTYANLKAKADHQLAHLKAAGAIKGKPLLQPGYLNFGAQISPDHLKLAAIVTDEDFIPAIRIWTRKTTHDAFGLSTEPVHKDKEPLIPQHNIHQLSWRNDSRTIIYDHSEFYHHFNSYNDLYELDTKNGHLERLTTGARAREVTVMPDNSLVFTVATIQNTQLMHSDRNGKNIKTLYVPPVGDRLSSPRPYEDGVIYSHRDSRGHEWIEAFSLTTKKTRHLTESHAIGEMHIMPIADPSVRGGFYYAASNSGVMNIYHYENGVSTAATNVTTYAMSPAIDTSTHQLIYSRLTGDGFSLETAPARGARTPATLLPMQDYPAAPEEKAPVAEITDEHNYHGVSYLWPQYVLPFIYLVPGGSIFELSTSNNDPLNHHQYSLEVGYDTRAGKPQEQLSYTNGSFPFFIDTNLANDYIYLAGAGLTEHITYAELDTRHYIFDSNKWLFGPEVTYQQTDYAPVLITQAGPGLSIFYNNVGVMRDYQISPETGESVNLGYDYFSGNYTLTDGATPPNLVNGSISYGNFHGNMSYYLAPKFLPKHNVISFKASAWVSPQLQNIFFLGSQQAGGEYLGSILPPLYLVRGYPVGEFLGWQLYTGNLEYRFPIYNQYSGPGTFPLFFNRWHGALLLDGATLKGGYYDSTTSPSSLLATNVGTFYLGTGGELRSDLTIGYGFNFTMRLGAYYGLTQFANGGFTYMLSFGDVL